MSKEYLIEILNLNFSIWTVLRCSAIFQVWVMVGTDVGKALIFG
jgi:hypothetical protein